MKTGSNWKRTDVTVKDDNSSVQVKLWNDRATDITEQHQGALVSFKNVEVDVFNNIPQLKTLDMTTIEVCNYVTQSFIISLNCFSYP